MCVCVCVCVCLCVCSSCWLALSDGRRLSHFPFSPVPVSRSVLGGGLVGGSCSVG